MSKPLDAALQAVSDMQSHTPTPWHVSQCGIYSEDPKAYKPGTPMGHALIACTGDDGDEREGQEQLANAAHIVKCVNMHDELIRCIKNIFYACQVKEYRDPLSHAQIADLARTVLEKARRLQ